MIALRTPLVAGLSETLWPRGGLATHAKALLAQPLLDWSWNRAVRGAVRAKPWPWTEAWPVARLTAPGVDGWSYVLADAAEDDLGCASGHLPGTAKPGAPGNSVVVGGRETPARFLQVLAAERLTLETADGGRRDFSIVGRRIAEARQIPAQPMLERPMLTLVACYPFDSSGASGSLRYVVTAVAQE